MPIKYDELDLLELFLSEPIPIDQSFDTGKIKYIKHGDTGFTLTFSMYVYEFRCDIVLNPFTLGVTILLDHLKDIFNSEFSNVTKLVKRGSMLHIKSDGKELASVSFGEDVSVRVNL